MMKMHHILLTLAVLAIVVFGAMQFMKMKKMKKEKFIMQLYRPTPVVSVPENEWDPASMLTQALPSKNGPKLVIEKGDYRRFNRV
jgi:hypothetical protein